MSDIRLEMSRVIIFTGRIHEMERFYSTVLGLPIAGKEDGWVELDGGGCSIALHAWEGEAPEGPIKLVFFASDVEAKRSELAERGADFGDPVAYGRILLSDGFDPDGNAIQLSGRLPVHL